MSSTEASVKILIGEEEEEEESGDEFDFEKFENQNRPEFQIPRIKFSPRSSRTKDDEEKNDNNIFDLTAINIECDPWDYINDHSFTVAFDYSYLQLKLRKQTILKIIKKHQEDIEKLMPFVFIDIHYIFIFKSGSIDDKPSDEIILEWQKCYSKMYSLSENKNALNAFLDMFPYYLAYSIYTVYKNLPTPLGITPPKRTKIAKRILFMFSSIVYLNSAVKAQFNKLFPPEIKLKPITLMPEYPPVLLPVEDLTGLVDIERRPKNILKPFDLNSQSPISTRIPKQSLHPSQLSYPKNGDRTFKKDLKSFVQKEKSVSDFTPDLDTKSLLMRARCKHVEHELQQVEMEAAVKRTKLMHFFNTDRELVEAKRLAVLNAEPEKQQKFIRQLRRNQIKGQFHEDPRITLQLLTAQPMIAADIPPLSTGVNGKIEKIVDSVLSQCAVEQRRQEEVEFHLSHEERNLILDVRRAFTADRQKSKTYY